MDVDTDHRSGANITIQLLSGTLVSYRLNALKPQLHFIRDKI